jgi:uncharacterized iron-regulated protein
MKNVNELKEKKKIYNRAMILRETKYNIIIVKETHIHTHIQICELFVYNLF